MNPSKFIKLASGLVSEKIIAMKILLTLISIVMCLSFTSCSVGRGCPSNGRNVGAEKILSGDPKAIKDMKKARKFKA